MPDERPTEFHTTRWTLVCDAAKGSDTGAVAAFGALFSTYWQPLYRYARRTGQSPADAEDMVQGFFAHLIEHNGLRLADRARGSFRAFLLGSLKHFMTNEWQRQHRQRRGGFATHLSIDWPRGERGLGVHPADSRSPDLLYDRDWAVTLLDKVLDDMAREESGLEFERWKAYLSLSSDHLPYAEMAVAFGLSEGAARVAVHRLRKRYRQRLKSEIVRTLASGEQVEEEMRALFAALAG